MINPTATVLLLTLAVAPPLSAQTARATTIRLDNDILALRGREAPPDYDYTHGLHLTFELDSAPRWVHAVPILPSCGGDDHSRSCLRTAFGVGQRIYTPRRDSSTPLPGERPYAAWLYASAAAAAVEPRREWAIEVQIGITGPPALGEPVQNGIHRLLGSERQLGWAHQLEFEPGVVLRYTDVRYFEPSLAKLGTPRVGVGWGITGGNVRTAAEAGATARWEKSTGRGITGMLGVRSELIARDLFLDGNTFRDNSLARKLPLVGEGEIGVGYAARAWMLEYRFVVRTREYRAQPEPHRYGSLVLTLRR